MVCRIGLRYRERPSNQSYETAGVIGVSGVIADSEHAMRVPFMVPWVLAVIATRGWAESALRGRPTLVVGCASVGAEVSP